MRLFVSTLVVCSFATLSLACGTAPDDEDVGADESEVRVARCPSRVDLQADAPELVDPLEATLADGTLLTLSQVVEVQHAIAASRARGAFAVHLALERTTTGRCYYAGDDGTSAVFQTSKGKNVFEIDAAEALSLVVLPKSYSPTGLVLAPSSRAVLRATVRVPRSETATVGVTIGTTSLAVGSDPAPSCPQLSPPSPSSCAGGTRVPRVDANGCTIGLDCVRE